MKNEKQKTIATEQKHFKNVFVNTSDKVRFYKNIYIE